MFSVMTCGNCFNQDQFEDLLLERRLIEAMKMLLDHTDWDLPRYDQLACCRFISNGRKLLIMHPEEIMSGGGSLGQGGSSERYNWKSLQAMVEKAEADLAKHNPDNDPTAGITFGVERNWRGRC